MIEVLASDVVVWVEAVRGFGLWGAAVYALIFVLATIAFVPASPLTAIAGFLFGPLWGTLLISPVGLVSALLAFGIGRCVARSWLQPRLASRPWLVAVDQTMKRDGFRFVFLLRLASVVPFAPLSYALGASRVPCRAFAIASWLGLLPGTFLYVYLGSLVADVGEILNGQAVSGDGIRWLTWVGLGAAVLAILSIARLARTAINQSINKEPSLESTF